MLRTVRRRGGVATGREGPGPANLRFLNVKGYAFFVSQGPIIAGPRQFQNRTTPLRRTLAFHHIS